MSDAVPENIHLRSAWNALEFAIGCLFLALAIAMAANMSRVDDLIPIVGGGVPGGWLALRIPFCGVLAGPDGIKYRGLFTTVRYEWREISRVVLAEVAGSVVTSACPAAELSSGASVEMRLLAGYGRGNRRVARQVSKLESMRVAATT